ncbi:MAG: LLM class flavin-dependent oxidoreductase [Actinobacteria bacterium]|nr:MAG: LLM class flavin-dependent oxidoreductase [Actinomycetota bacterium]
MKLGLVLTVFTADPAKPMTSAARAAATGFDAVFASDHLFPPGAPDRPSLEPYTLLAAIGAANPGLGVGVLVTRAGFRPVGMLAKQAAALDQVSGGRAVLGLGVGDANGRAEHAALGLDYPPFPERLALLEETVLALPLLPPGSPPVWVGGTKDAAIGVAARAADGWNAWGLGADAFVARAGELAGLATGAGRDPAEVPPTWAGIMLVGRDANELATLEAERAGKGLGMDIWRGTADDLRRLRDRVEGVGATWLIAVAAGPADRSELLAATLRA